MGWSATPAAAPAVQTSQPAAPAVAPAAVVSPVQKTEKIAAKKAKAIVKLPAVVLQNEKVSYKIDPAAGSVESITLLDYKNASQTAPVALDKISSSRGAFSLFGALPWTLESIVSSRKSGNTYVLTRRMRESTGQSFTVTQTWKLNENSYAADFSVTFTNPGKNTLNISNAVLNGCDVAPWAVVSGDKVRIPSHRMDYLTDDGDYADIKADKKDASFFVKPAPGVKWVSLSNKYFASILESATPFTLYQSREFLNNGKDDYYVISAGAALGNIQLAPGKSQTFDFKYYSGPKIIADLDKFDSSTGRVMHLAWGPLDYLARLLLWLLVKFHALLGSYGWSIVLLTLVVRIVFYPLTARGNASMRKMQQVQPQLKALREKYKDNPQLMNSKMMELYRTEGVNPFGGCLPILLQIPVFFALYATLDGAVELRQVSFLWCKDLAAADTVYNIPLIFFNLPVNPLVLAMTALMVIQQHMTPMSMDPMQKKMMALMPIVMLFMLYDLPSGLTLYWTVSNFFSIIQLKLQQRSRAAAETTPASTGKIK